MCGIVGALSSSPVDPAVVAGMRDLLAHRGPDHAGLWSSADGTVCLGHRRLAIIDPQPESNQPFVSVDGRYSLTFNGEIYNFKRLRAELEPLGSVFRTGSDTEVVLEAFRHWRGRCLDRFSGMFAFAIWDARDRILFCARDRAGEKPFYYGTTGRTFLFGSELKALLAWPGITRSLSGPALADYLTFGFVPDPKSIWEGFYKLPPGHSMQVQWREDAPPIVREPLQYWDMEFGHNERLDDLEPLLRETLQRASAEMTVADVPLGVFLSGGVDSSSITAAVRRAGHTPRTFTVGFSEDGYDERQWARQVADLYETIHTERVVNRDDLDPVFDRLLWHYDEPFNDYSYLPTYYLCREARRSITVALSGDGGDELFAGYRKYQRLGLREELSRVLPARVGRYVADAAAVALPETSRLRRTIVQHGSSADAALTDTLMLGFTVPALRAAARGDLSDALARYSPADVVTDLLRKAPPGEVGLINASRYLDLKLTLAGDILVKVDRASMAVSLEVRPVFLHRDLLDLAGRIPSALLAGRNRSKGILKDALRPWLPDSVLYRRKMGFALPLEHWISGNGVGGLRPTSRVGAMQDLIDPSLVDRLSQAHTAGKANHTARIHSLYFLDRWLDRWIS
jgi:asparagine synthase (glutamine-hydrolysing)